VPTAALSGIVPTPQRLISVIPHHSSSDRVSRAMAELQAGAAIDFQKCKSGVYQ
jgi:hypothetical protein